MEANGRYNSADNMFFTVNGVALFRACSRFLSGIDANPPGGRRKPPQTGDDDPHQRSSSVRRVKQRFPAPEACNGRRLPKGAHSDHRFALLLTD